MASVQPASLVRRMVFSFFPTINFRKVAGLKQGAFIQLSVPHPSGKCPALVEWRPLNWEPREATVFLRSRRFFF